MIVFVTCKNEEDPIKNAQSIIYLFFRSSMADNSPVSGGIWPKSKLIQAFMVVLLTCKNEEDPIKNECTRVLTRFLPLKVYGDFSRTLRQLTTQSVGASGQISNSFEILWLSSLPARMKIQLKTKALEC